MKQPVDLNLRERIVDHLSEIPFKDLRTLACWIGLPLAGMFSLYVAFRVVCTTIDKRVEYAGFELGGWDEAFWSGHVGSYRGRGTPESESELFLKLPEHEPVSIHEITPEYLERIFAIQGPEMERDGSELTGYGFSLSMYFEQGRLNEVMISYVDGVTCSNRRDGQYIAFPIPCGELYKAWGKPNDKGQRRWVNWFRVD